MLKGPALKSSGLHISVFQGGPDRGAFNMFENLFKKCSKIRKKVKTYKFKNYIDFNVDLINVPNSEKYRPKDLRLGAFSICPQK